MMGRAPPPRPVTPMGEWDIAVRLASGLADLTWTSAAIKAGLHRRLPRPLHHYAGDIARTLAAEGIGAGRAVVAPSRDHIASVLSDHPVIERIHAYCERRRIWPSFDLKAPEMRPASPFAALDLPRLETPAALADWFGITLDRLDQMADRASRAERTGLTEINHYRYWTVPMARGGVRLIEAPKPGLKALQRHVARGMLARVPVHDAAHGFVAGRDCLGAAALHAGEAAVVSFDIADFFWAVGAGRVHGLFRLLGYPDGVARLLTGLATTATPPRWLVRLPAEMRPKLRMAHLSQGAPSSPAIATLAAFGLDRRLAGHAARLGARYTRYADDLSFSGPAGIVGPLMRLVPEIAADEGFALASAKTRAMRAPARQRVTGIVVNEGPNLARDAYDRLKAEIHAASRPGDLRLADPAYRRRLEGRIGWLEQVRPAKGAKLRARYEAALSVPTPGP